MHYLSPNLHHDLYYWVRQAGDAIRHVQICPLYAVSQMEALLKG